MKLGEQVNHWSYAKQAHIDLVQAGMGVCAGMAILVIILTNKTKTMKILQLAVLIITVFGTPQYGNGQPTNPPGDVGTNGWIFNNTIPSNALQWVVSGSTNFELFNTLAHHLYVIDDSSNLINWSLLVPAFTNSGTRTITLDPTNEIGFLRAREVTYQTIYKLPGIEAGNTPCGGSYAGYVVYRTNNINTNTIIHTFHDTDNLNRNMQAVGNHGHIVCGNGFVVLSNLSSTSWNLTLYFSNNVPTNPHPIVLGGFLP